MAELADKWVEVSSEIPGSSGMTQQAILRFSEHVQGQMDVASQPDFQLHDLRVRHLDAWEMSLLENQRLHPTDSPYRKAVQFFALLRRIDDDDSGRLHAKVVDRLARPTRLSHIRKAGRSDFSDGELRRLRSAAHRLVFRANLDAQREGAPIPTRDVLVALFILLALATGEPPEVLRQLTYDDVVASAAPGHGVPRNASLEHLVRSDIVDAVCITYTKSRSGLKYDEVYNRKLHHALHHAIRGIVTISAAARQQTNERSLWLVESKGEVNQVNWANVSFRQWCDSYVHGERIEGKAQFSRLRKSVVRRELVESPTRYLRDGRRHTSRTLIAHYTNSSTLRAHAGTLLIGTIEGLFAGAIGPTVITPEAEEILRESVGGSDHLASTDPRVDLSSAHKGGLADCMDPLDSPHAPEGSLCPVALAGQCFTCPNAVITQEHLPALVEMSRISAPESSTDPAVWREVWEPTYRSTTSILQLFPANKVREASDRGQAVLVDLGIRNGPRGLDE
ncbi:hypothetical protein [Pseudarthrobacter sp. N5]|uniref:hypothetical protein n=1 Tax=Pseudarthrobacter sp. N5 TaxID=3418416 RepID=UPI003CFBBAD1